MAVLTIRNLPEKVRDGLRRRAAAAGVSMEAQARAILADASQVALGRETAASLQQWVDDLYGRRKPKSAAMDLLIERRRAVDAEHAAVRKRQSKASPRR